MMNNDLEKFSPSKTVLVSKAVKPEETGTESEATTNCRFCGARIEEDSTSCPKCKVPDVICQDGVSVGLFVKLFCRIFWRLFRVQ